MRHAVLIVFSVLTLSACEPEIARDGAASASRHPSASHPDTETLVRNASKAIDSAAATQPPASTTRLPDTASPPEPARTSEEHSNDAGLSDEQDFEAVSNRETIQSDAERIEANRQQYRVVQPTDLPARPRNLGPNVVDYALATNNPVGEPLYRRIHVLAEGRFSRNCARYVSSDLAQRDFLARGGPEKDFMGLDPDGDGYACYWDPTPFRAALRAASGN